MEEKKYCIYIFKGIIEHHCKEDVRKNMSIKTCLEKVFDTVWDRNTSQFFKREGFIFEADYMTMETIRQKIAEGLSIFPIGESTDIDIVRSYVDLGLTPVFMKYRDFQGFKKDYKEYI